MIKQSNQLTFGMQEDNSMRKKKTMLDTIEQVIDFRSIEKLLATMYKRGMGRPAIPPLMLFKMLLLEQWYGLSDVRVVEEIHDRRSFERFVGQDVRQYHVDDTTLVKFRNRIREAEIEEDLFECVNKQLEEQGLFIRKRTIIDSTIVQGATKAGAKRGNGTPVDPDVTRTVRQGQVREGMKVHVSMDHGSELIENIALTNVTLHDHQVFAEMIPDDSERVYTDKAYDSEEHRQYLKAIKKWNGIMQKAIRGAPLTFKEKERNRRLSRIRSRIEAKMNDLKRWCHLVRLRYYSKARNWIQVICAAIGANLKRCVRLIEA